MPPQLKPRALKVLGTDDVDALRLEAKSLFEVSNLLAKAEAARVRREAAGVSDRVEVAQQSKPPPFTTALVGKRLEICWPFKEDGNTVKIWASGRVVRIADGLTDTRSAKAKKVLPAGAILWAWTPTRSTTSQPERSGSSSTHSGGTSMYSMHGGMTHASWGWGHTRRRSRASRGSSRPRQMTSI